jgi:hypothetical protein
LFSWTIYRTEALNDQVITTLSALIGQALKSKTGAG